MVLWEVEDDEYDDADDAGYLRQPVPHQQHFIATQLELSAEAIAEAGGELALAAEAASATMETESERSSVSLESYGMDRAQSAGSGLPGGSTTDVACA